jgi:iron(III) transport system substrate-binding protein
MTPAVKSLYEAAKKEGAVTWWTSDDPAIVTKIMAHFNSAYPGIKVTPVQVNPTDGIQKILGESQAGKTPDVDLFETSYPNLKDLTARSLVKKVDWAKYGAPDDQVIFDGQAIKFMTFTLCTAYNTNALKPDQVPSTLDDLVASPIVKDGKLGLEARGWAFGILAQKVGQDKALAALDSLLTNKPLVMQGNPPLAQQLASGEIDVAFTILTSSVLELKNEGAPIDCAPTDPILGNNNPNTVLAGGEHPNAATLLALWLNSGDAIKAYTDAGLYPEKLAGDNIPDYDQKILDTGYEVIQDEDTPESLKIVGDTDAAAADKMSGLVTE